LRTSGRVVGIGASAMQDRSFTNAIGLLTNVMSMITLNSIDMIMRSTTFCGVNLKAIAVNRPELVAECMTKVMQLFNEGKLRTYVSNIYDWKNINQAHKDMESRKTKGKLILQISV